MLQPENDSRDVLPLELEDDAYEVINSEEVDRTLEELDRLIQAAHSENVRACLEDAAEQIYALMYDDDDEVESESGAA